MKTIDFLVNNIEKYTGVLIDDVKKNIFAYDGIFAIDMLYVIEAIENEYGITAREIFHDTDSEIMTVQKLEQKITKGN